MAPEFISGFWGRWGALISSLMMELKGSALGSTPTRVKTTSSPQSSRARPRDATLEMDCMVIIVPVSPAEQTRPSSPQ